MPGKVKVKIVAGRNLPVMDRSSDTTDAYVEVKLGNTTFKTDVCRKSLNPQWNSEWYRFEMDDAELQDEPLQIRLMDHDTYSANDAIGKVYLDLNPLLLPPVGSAPKAAVPEATNSISGGNTMSGWFPVYDTMHGIRGEVNVIVKVELFSDFNKFRQSSCGVQFFNSSTIPVGYQATVVHGMVEELVVSDDPEYQWIDKIRTPRASNEARQTLFFKLSGEVQRRIGLKVLDFGGNAVIGYLQCFDLEAECGIVVRGLGTAVTLVRVQEPSHPLPCHYAEELDNHTTPSLKNPVLSVIPASPLRQSPMEVKHLKGFLAPGSPRNRRSKSPQLKQPFSEYKPKRLGTYSKSFNDNVPPCDNVSLKVLFEQEDMRGEAVSNRKKIFERLSSFPKRKFRAFRSNSAGTFSKKIQFTRSKSDNVASSLIRSIMDPKSFLLDRVPEGEEGESKHSDTDSVIHALRYEDGHLVPMSSSSSDSSDSDAGDISDVSSLSSTSKGYTEIETERNKCLKELALNMDKSTSFDNSITSSKTDDEVSEKDKSQFCVPESSKQDIFTSSVHVVLTPENDDETHQFSTLVKFKDSPSPPAKPKHMLVALTRQDSFDVLSNNLRKRSDTPPLSEMDPYMKFSFEGKSSYQQVFYDTSPVKRVYKQPSLDEDLKSRPVTNLSFPESVRHLPTVAVGHISNHNHRTVHTIDFSDRNSAVSLLVDSTEQFEFSAASLDAPAGVLAICGKTECGHEDTQENVQKAEEHEISSAETLPKTNDTLDKILNNPFKFPSEISAEKITVINELQQQFEDHKVSHKETETDYTEPYFTQAHCDNIEQTSLVATSLVATTVDNFPNHDVSKTDLLADEIPVFKENDLSKTNLHKLETNYDLNEEVLKIKNENHTVYNKICPVQLSSSKSMDLNLDVGLQLIKECKIEGVRKSSPDSDQKNKSQRSISKEPSEDSEKMIEDEVKKDYGEIETRIEDGNKSPVLKSGENNLHKSPKSPNNEPLLTFDKTTQSSIPPDILESDPYKSVEAEIDNRANKGKYDSSSDKIYEPKQCVDETLEKPEERDSNVVSTNQPCGTVTANLSLPHHPLVKSRSATGLVEPCSVPTPRTVPEESATPGVVTLKASQSPVKFNHNHMPGIHRRSSDSDLSITPKGNSLTSSGDRSSIAGGYRNFQPLSSKLAMKKEPLEVMEFPFLTMMKFPPGFVVHIAGTVTSRSVKLLERVTNQEEPESRDAWWKELRLEVRSHMKAMSCNAVIGYSENTTICDDVCVLSASGTAAVVNVKNTCVPPVSETPEPPAAPKAPAPAPPTSAPPTNTSMTTSLDRTDFERTSSFSQSTPLKPDSGGGGSGKTRHHSDSLDQPDTGNPGCALCHLPFNPATVPLPMTTIRCAVCRKRKVPDLLLATVEPLEGLPIIGHACLIHVCVTRPKQHARGEMNACVVSDSLPFIEYDIYKQLVNKLKVNGMNAVFGLKTQICLGERLIAAVTSGTALYLEPLPPPSTPSITAGEACAADSRLASVLRGLQDTVRKNREFYQVRTATTASQEAAENGTEGGGSDTEDSDDDLPDMDLHAGNKEACVFMVDDEQDMEVVSQLIDPHPPEGFFVTATETLPGLDDLEVVRNLQMFTQIWRSRLPSTQPTSSMHKHFHRLLQGIYYKLRRMTPCAVGNIKFRLALPEPDEMQISIVGMAVGLGEIIKNTRSVRRRAGTLGASSKPDSLNTSKKSDDGDMIFSLEEDQESNSPHSSKNARPKSPARPMRQSTHLPPRERYGVDITPLAYIPGGHIERYLGNLNFFFIRETSCIREGGGMSGFVHSFVAEVLAIIRAHVTALGGNAMVAFFLNECIILNNPHKNHGQCLINVGGDAVSVSYID